jgi:hypothetical protein
MESIFQFTLSAWTLAGPGVSYWLSSDGPGIDSRWCHWIFQWHISFRPYHGPGVDPVPSETEYQEHFLGIKAAGAWGWQPYHLHVPNVMEIWYPKPPGTLWATPGLLGESFTFTFYLTVSVSSVAEMFDKI